MSDQPTSPGAEEAPSPPPLRAAFLIWPGKVHGQTWMFLWLGVAYLIGSLLPWHGPNDVEYVLKSPYEIDTQTSVSSLTAVHYAMAKKSHQAYPNRYADPGDVAAVREPGLAFGTFLILLCSISMIVIGVCNIWNRRLSLSPTLCTWFIALAVLYFARGHWAGESLEAGQIYEDPFYVNGFTQLGDTLGAVFGNFGDIIGGHITADMSRVFDRFGLGFYVTMLAELFLIVFIVFSIVSGSGKKKDGPPAAASRRPAGKGFPAKDAPAKDS